MIALGVSSSLNAVATTGSTVTYTVTGALMSNASPPVVTSYEVLAQGQIAASAGALFSTSSSQTALVSDIHLLNTSASAVQTVSLYIAGTATTNQINTLIIPIAGWAHYEAGNGWIVYNSVGTPVTGSSVGGALGTPATASQAAATMTAGSANIVPGSLFQLPTGSLVAGSTFRWTINLSKTAAGTATFTVTVKFGTAGTTSDAAIATWTSGTNTAIIDYGLLVVTCNILTTGSGGTANCLAYYSHNPGVVATGLGLIGVVPGSTATLNTTSASPYFHIDVTPGSSAVMVGNAIAERLA